MAIQTIKATIQMRKGLETDFDADQMTAGEWAVSTDTKYVRMCFAPGIVLRMATYEAFEEDMLEIQTILATCQNIQTAVEAFEQLALQHKNDAATSAANAETSETNAKTSETAAKNSQTAAKASETNAKTSETNALASKNAASASANTASTKASEAEASATNAAGSATTATQKASAASASAANAANSASTATQKSNDAATSAEAAEGYSKMSKSWAVGDTGVREDEASNNSKYYAEQAERIVSAASSGALIPMGTITFLELPTTAVSTGYMYNISNDFTSDSRFEDGGNIPYKAGSNVYYTANGKWDVLSGTQVTGVKGGSESNFRIGNVNITKENIDLGNVPNVATNDQTPTFTQASTIANIASGEKLSIIFGKVMKFFADLKAVAFSGSYDDLIDKPSIPEAYSLPLASASARGGAKIGYEQNDKNYPVQLSNEQMYVNVPWTDTNTTYSVATQSANGLMSAADKKKLDGVASGADKTTYTNNLLETVAGTALDAVQGKVLDDKITELNGNMEALEGNVFLKNEGLGSMASGVHLNTVTVSGLYFCTGTNGRPVSSDGFMIVMSHTNGARAIQIYFPYSGGMYKRIKASDAWGSWALISNA